MKTTTDDNARGEKIGSLPAPAAVGGDLALANALIAAGVVPQSVVNPLLQRLSAERAAAAQTGQPLTVLQLLVSEQLAKLEDLLAIVVERSGLPYLPLASYDVDRDIACLLPREFAFEFCLVPFDRISRCVLIATANPLDLVIRERVGALLSCDLFWYVSSPEEITNALRQAHGLNQPAASEQAKA